MKSLNPYTQTLIKEYEPISDADLEIALAKADAAFESWRETTFESRAQRMGEAAVYLRQEKERLARLMVEEMGKPIGEARSEVEKCAWVCDYYAEHAPKFLADEALPVDEGEAYIAYSPLGPVLAVMPWNFPLWQVFRFAAPALMAGNVGLLKHASNVPGSALAIEETFKAAGFPEGCFQTLLLESSRVGQVLDDPRVKAVTLTGSEYAGSQVAEQAGKNLKKTVLELGGSDPFIVLADADLELALENALKSRMVNNGQSCIAAKRFIVEQGIAEEFTERFAKALGELKLGDPMEESTDVGPLARQDLAKELHQQVQDSVAAGARLVLGGEWSEDRGAFYPPTLITQVKPGMRAYHEELFGPVAVVLEAEDEDDAIRLANDSDFGLGGSVWTGDAARGQRVARRVESGAVYVNKMMASHPAVPFGGIKKSGYGRELAHLGIREFCNAKTVWVG